MTDRSTANEGFSLPFTKNPEALAPAFFAKEPLLPSSELKNVNTFLQRAIQDTFQQMKLSGMELISLGSEHLVFTYTDSELQRNFVVKANYEYALELYEDLFLREQDPERAMEQCRALVAAEAERQKAEWRKLAQAFPEAAIPTLHLSVQEIPVSFALFTGFHDLKRSDRLTPRMKHGATLFPVLITQQRQRMQVPKGRCFDLGFTPFWHTYQQMQNMYDCRYFEQQIDACANTLIHGVPAKAPVRDLVLEMISEFEEMYEYFDVRPEERAQMTDMVRSLDRYMETTRRTLDFTGNKNIEALYAEKRSNAAPHWQLQFTDPFLGFPALRKNDNQFSLLEDLFHEGCVTQPMTRQVREALRVSINMYYAILTIKALCVLFDVPSTLQLSGQERIRVQDLRKLYFEVFQEAVL